MTIDELKNSLRLIAELRDSGSAFDTAVRLLLEFMDMDNDDRETTEMYQELTDKKDKFVTSVILPYIGDQEITELMGRIMDPKLRMFVFNTAVISGEDGS